MPVIEYHSRYIMTTRDKRYFVGKDEDEAMYKLLVGSGFNVPKVPTEAEITTEYTDLRAALEKDPKFIDEQIRNLTSASLWINEGISKEDAHSIARRLYADGFRDHMGTFIPMHVAEQAVPAAFGRPQMNDYNSVRVKIPDSGQYVRVYTGCLRQNPLGIKKEYQFHCANSLYSGGPQVAIILDADRFADITKIAGIDGIILDRLEQDVMKADAAEKRKMIGCVKGLWAERYVERAKPCCTGYHGVKAEIFDLFNPFRLFENMLCTPEVHPFLRFYKDRQLTEALSTIDLQEARMLGNLLDIFSKDSMMIEYFTKKARLHYRKRMDSNLTREVNDLHTKMQKE